MSWVKPVLGSVVVALGALLAGAASAAIVVSSSGPSAAQFPPGRKLGDNDRITLQKGDSVTVLDARGTKVLRGPGRLAVSQPGRALPNPAFAVLTRKDAASRARTGAVRAGDDGKIARPNIWLVDVTTPGKMCIAAPDAVRIWRPDAAKAARYRIASSAGTAATVSFDAAAPTATWDAAKAPISDGASYTIAQPGGAAGTFSFAVLANPPADAEGLALALIDKGCTAQLDLLTKTLATARF